jgi:hypothetical protein
LTGRVGEGEQAARYAAHKKGVKIRFGKGLMSSWPACRPGRKQNKKPGRSL